MAIVGIHMASILDLRAVTIVPSSEIAEFPVRPIGRMMLSYDTIRQALNLFPHRSYASMIPEITNQQLL